MIVQKKLKFNLSGQRYKFSLKNKIFRQIWNFIWLIFFRFSPRSLCRWRAFILRLFGAKLGENVRVWPSCKVWAPWNLKVGNNTRIGEFVDIYSVTSIKIGPNSIISQYSYLCTATHDYNDPRFPLILKEIVIGESCWIAAGAYIGPGVKVGDGAIIAAKSCVVKDVEEWVIVGGNPAKIIKKR